MIRILLLALLLIVFAAKGKAESIIDATEISFVRLSPDGDQLAYAMQKDNISEIYVKHSETRISQPFNLNRLKLNKHRLQNLQWVNKNVLLIELSQEVIGIGNLENTRSQIKRYLLKISEDQATFNQFKEIESEGWISHIDVENGRILFARSSRNSSVYSINPDTILSAPSSTGKFRVIDAGEVTAKNKIQTTSGYVVRWFFHNNRPSAALKFTDTKVMELSQFHQQGERSVYTWKLGEEDEPTVSLDSLIPIGYNGTKDRYYATFKENDYNQTLYEIDYNSQTFTQLETHSDGKIIKLIQSQINHELIGATVINQGRIGDIYFSNNENKFQLSDQLSVEIARSLNDAYTLRYTEASNHPGSFSIIDKNGRTTLQLMRLPHFDPTPYSQTDSHFITLDGQRINYFQTYPRNIAPHGLLVLVHGGPIGAYDTPYFDQQAEFFARQGLVVVRVNYRGSGGYGKEFLDAGKAQWSTGMLKDILASTQETLKSSKFMKLPVCIGGFSYGGYAAAQLAATHPEVYQCAFSAAGVSDLNLLVQDTSMSKRQFNWLKEQLGDAASEPEKLYQLSPVARMNQDMGPLLIIHGSKDERAPVEHAYRLHRNAKSLGLPVTLVELADEDHYFDLPGSKQKVFSVISDFLKNAMQSRSTNSDTNR